MDLLYENQQSLSLALKPISSHLMRAIVSTHPTLTSKIREKTIALYQEHVRAAGLDQVPASYIHANYQREVALDLKKFILYYLVVDYLTKNLIDQQVPVAGNPRLVEVVISEDPSITYHFDLSLADQLEIREWKHFLFRAPRRKNYKDLDKQVEIFLRKAQEKSRKAAVESVEPGDWVFFLAQLIDKNGEQTMPWLANGMWIKIKPESLMHPLYEAFVHKRVGDAFISNKLFFNDYMEESLYDQHYFLITIKAITKGDTFAVDLFKTTFKLSNKAEIHEKLIEVFSYRNDISQRRSIIEEMFHLLFSKHRFEVPKHLILRKQEEVLNGIRARPDYQAYRATKSFSKQVSMLAEKLLKEEIIIDQIASVEKIGVDTRDIQQYLNLMCIGRLREFIYFRPLFDLEETATPINQSTLEQVCRREKTLNYILHQLTR